MKYILDASVAVKWALQEIDSAQAIALREDVRNQRCELLVPDSFPVEIAHALTRAERRGLISQGEALTLLADILSVPLDIRPYLPFLNRAVELASLWRIGVYDCLYVALAEQEQCELVTADNRLLNVVQGRFPVILLSSL